MVLLICCYSAKGVGLMKVMRTSCDLTGPHLMIVRHRTVCSLSVDTDAAEGGKEQETEYHGP